MPFKFNLNHYKCIDPYPVVTRPSPYQPKGVFTKNLIRLKDKVLFARFTNINHSPTQPKLELGVKRSLAVTIVD